MLAACLILGLLSTVGCVGPPGRASGDFSYSGTLGPDNWATLFPSYCSGTSQSPVDLTSPMVAATDPGAITLTGYDTALTATVENTGKTAKLSATVTSGSLPSISGGRLPSGNTFEFLQLHWHWGSVDTQGSEHTIDGTKYPMEVHLVHWNKKYSTVADALTYSDGLAVLGFMYEVSTADNGNLKAVTDKLSSIATIRKKRKNKKGGKRQGRVGPLCDLTNTCQQQLASSVTLDSTITLNDILPTTGAGDAYYYYQGGLTTPTCNEVVLWTVFTSTIPVSATQLASFRALKDSAGAAVVDNWRPVQPINSRTIYQRTGTATTSNTQFMDNAVGAGVGSVVMYGAIASGLLPSPVAASTRRRDFNFNNYYRNLYKN